MNPRSAVDLAQALLRCPSVTPAEGGALALLDAVLGAAGFAVERPVFSEPGTPDVENLYARIGTSGPVLVLAGHTDVVPSGDAARWTHAPFAGEIVDGVLYGARRGGHEGRHRGDAGRGAGRSSPRGPTCPARSRC